MEYVPDGLEEGYRSLQDSIDRAVNAGLCGKVNDGCPCLEPAGSTCPDCHAIHEYAG